MKYKLPIFIFVLVAFFYTATSPVHAQLFSGSDISNYNCAVLQDAQPTTRFGALLPANDPHIPYEKDGRFLCAYRPGAGGLVELAAIPKPAPLTILQVWFVRLIAVAWGVSGVAFTGLLIWIGFKYMTSFSNQYELGKVIEDFRKWMVGLALVFLSYPFLVTFFRVLPLSQTECYDDINVPGFQFFFPEACVVDTCLQTIQETFGGLNSPEANRAYQTCLDNQ